jgi:glycosyltransferase involved in cell wall biosynthesis
VAEQIYNDPRIHHIEWLDDVVPAYMVMDLLFLPTYREGFSNVVLEAAAMELPMVATKVTGCVDAVVDGVTGILVPPRDPNALSDAIRKLLKDPELRQRMGKAGRERVVRDFKPEDIWKALYQEYVRLLKEKGIPVPPGDVSAFCQ